MIGWASSILQAQAQMQDAAIQCAQAEKAARIASEGAVLRNQRAVLRVGCCIYVMSYGQTVRAYTSTTILGVPSVRLV